MSDIMYGHVVKLLNTHKLVKLSKEKGLSLGRIDRMNHHGHQV